jgi:hypothetical protein
MAERMLLGEVEGAHSLSFACGELPVDEVIADAGHEPNGYFWEGVAQFLAPDLVAQVELDSESSMFCAYGGRGALERLRRLLKPCLEDGRRVAKVIRDAEAAGFQFVD